MAPPVQLLVSVKDAAEARRAIAAGAGWIDIKQPDRGSLGRPDAAAVEAILRAVGPDRCVSLAWGELAEAWEDPPAPWRGRIAYVKLGLAGMGHRADWPDRWRMAADRLAPLAPLVAVVYADWPVCSAPEAWRVAEMAGEAGASALLLDTWSKDRGTLVDWWDRGELGPILPLARRHGMTLVLGGGLHWRDLPWALDRCPDVVAMRGGLCRGGRNGTLDGHLVRQALKLLCPVAPVDNGATPSLD